MKQVPFTIEFVSTFKNDKDYEHIPAEVMERVCKEGLVELLRPRMKELNAGGTEIFVNFAQDTVEFV